MREYKRYLNRADLQDMYFSGMKIQDIAAHFKVACSTITKYIAAHRIPKRGRIQKCGSKTQDPTPEEIEERKAELKRRHMEYMRSLG